MYTSKCKAKFINLYKVQYHISFSTIPLSFYAHLNYHVIISVRQYTRLHKTLKANIYCNFIYRRLRNLAHKHTHFLIGSQESPTTFTKPKFRLQNCIINSQRISAKTFNMHTHSYTNVFTATLWKLNFLNTKKLRKAPVAAPHGHSAAVTNNKYLQK